MTGEKKRQPWTEVSVDKSVEERKNKTLGRTVILWYKLCISKPHQCTLEPVKVDIKRSQTKNKTLRKYSIKL